MEHLLNDSLVTAIVAGIVLGVLKAGKELSDHQDDKEPQFDSPQAAQRYYERKAQLLKQSQHERAQDLVSDISSLVDELKGLNEDAYTEFAQRILDDTVTPIGAIQPSDSDIRTTER